MPDASPGFNQRPSDVGKEGRIGFWGQLFRNIHTRTGSGLNTNPQAVQVTTILVPATVEDAATYTLSEGDRTASYLTESTDRDDLGNGLVTAFGEDGVLNSRWTLTYSSSTNLLTATGTDPSVSGTFTVSSGNTDDLGAPTLVTAAALADPVKPGRIMVSLALGVDTPNANVFVAKESNFTAQVTTHTITAAVGDSFQPILTIGGETYYGPSVPFNTTITQTAIDIAAAIEALAPADVGVLGTSNAADVISTAEVPGAEFRMQIIASGPTAVAAFAATTGPSIATSFQKAFIGPSVRREGMVSTVATADNPVAGPNQGVEYAMFGTMAVQKPSGETWARGNDVWVSLHTSDGTAGRSYNTSAASRVWMPPALLSIQRGGTVSSDAEVGVISIKGA